MVAVGAADELTVAFPVSEYSSRRPEPPQYSRGFPLQTMLQSPVLAAELLEAKLFPQ